MRSVLFMFAALSLVVGTASATVTVTLVETGTASQAISVPPGGSFSVDVLVTESGEGSGISGLQIALNASGPASGKIVVTGPADVGGTSAAINAPEWDADISAFGTGLGLVAGALPLEPYGAGYLANAGILSGVVTPSSRFATYQVSVAADAPEGAYQLNASGLAFPDFVSSTDDITLSPATPLTIQVAQATPVCSRTVVGRHLWYKGAAASFSNVAVPNKTALLPSQGPGTFANVSSYSRGINGLYVDLQPGESCDPLTVSAADFEFKYGNSASPTTDVAAVATVTVQPGAGVGGSDRVVIAWPDNPFPTKNWLQVRLKANPNTGLPTDDVFYFGLLIGEIGLGNSGVALAVTSNDYNAVFNNQVQTLPGVQPITSLYDFNRDRNVTSADYNLSFNERGSLLNPAQRLELISP